jgi:hypothetical protein
MKFSKSAQARLGLMARMAAVAAVTVIGMIHSPGAQADTLLKAATTMVYGSSADTYSITAPSAGTLTAQVSTVPWPTPLSALSFNVSDATSVLSGQGRKAAQDAGGMQPQIETFQVGAGTYFAHVMATATGQLNLGLYSVLFTFTPSAVPLPTTIGLLLVGLLVFFGLRKTVRTGAAVQAATFGASC